MALLLMPYTNLHELNLDWIINALKESGVESVNGQSGIVVLYQDATVEFPAIPTDLNWSIQRKTNGTQVGIKFNKAAPLQRIYGNSTFAIYDEGNPPAYPVSSVNGQTGSVTVPVAFDSMAGDLLNVSTASPEHSWTLNRKTRDGDAGLTIDTTGDNPKLTLDFINNDESVDESLRILTEKDNPKGVFVDHESKNSYTIPMTDYVSGVYWMSLMYLQTGPSAAGLYMIFADSNQVQVSKLAGDSVITFTGTKSGNNIILNASDTVWGGIRAFTMN